MIMGIRHVVFMKWRPMKVEYLLATHTARYDKGSRASVMMRIASLSVAIAIAVMIVSLAVIQGFRHEIHSDLKGFAADIVVVDMAALGHQEGIPINANDKLAHRIMAIHDVENVAAFASIGGMVKSGDNICGLQIKGVGAEYDPRWWQSKIVEGDMLQLTEAKRHKELLLSQATARLLGVGIGDKIEVLCMDDKRPRRDRFKVTGLYHTGFEELDKVTALADIRDVQRLASWSKNEISGYDVTLLKDADTEYISRMIEAHIFEEYEAGNDDMASMTTSTLQGRYPVMFDWLKAHDVNAAVIIVIMMVVLLFNMASAMLIMVLDRTGMIGVLKAQGMRNGAVRKIFLWRAALLYAKGAVWGNVVGLVICFVQWQWSPIKLNPEGYMLSELPIGMELWWVVALNVGVFGVTLLTMMLPSFIISRIHPVESLKYRQ